MAVIFSDDFASTLNASWTNLNAWAAGNMTTSGGVAAGAGINQVTGNAIVAYNGGGVPDDHYAKFTISSQSFESTGYNAFAIARCDGTVNTSGAQMNFYAAVVPQTVGNGSARNCKLVKVINGTMTTLGAEASIAVSNGDVIEIRAVGTTISFYRNGVEEFSRTDSALTTGTFGFGLSNIVPRADDFEGGSLGASASQAPRSMHILNMMRG